MRGSEAVDLSLGCDVGVFPPVPITAKICIKVQRKPSATDETEIIRCMFRIVHQSAVKSVICNIAALLKLEHETARLERAVRVSASFTTTRMFRSQTFLKLFY